MRPQSGFTLIELLLVLAIIGIVSAIAIPALLGQREKAKARAVESLVNNIAGEVARSAEDLRENAGTAFNVYNLPDKVLLLSNYRYPKAKNPYGGTSTPYLAGNGTLSPGMVRLWGRKHFTDPVSGETHDLVIIRGQYLQAGAVINISKYIATD